MSCTGRANNDRCLSLGLNGRVPQPRHNWAAGRNAVKASPQSCALYYTANASSNQQGGQGFKQALLRRDCAMIHGATQRPQPRATLANGNAHILGLAALTEAVSAVANDNATERAESIGRADWSCLHARLAKRLEADGETSPRPGTGWWCCCHASLLRRDACAPLPFFVSRPRTGWCCCRHASLLRRYARAALPSFVSGRSKRACSLRGAYVREWDAMSEDE